MKKIIEDLHVKPESASFEKEERVRIGIVVRICQVLDGMCGIPRNSTQSFPSRYKAGKAELTWLYSTASTPDVLFELRAVGKH